MKKRHLAMFAICSAVLIQCSNPNSSAPGDDIETPNPDAKNCSLSGLTTSVGYWETAFASGATDYTLLEIPQSIAAGMTCTASAGATGQTLKVSVNGGAFTALSSGAASAAINPPLGDNTITINVTSPDGMEKRDYTVAVRVFKVDSTVINSGVIQFPTVVSGSPGGQLAIYSRVYQPGIVLINGVPNGLHAQFGIGPDGTDPRESDSWSYYATNYNTIFGNDYEYLYNLTIPGVSGEIFRYAFRFSLDGHTWKYFDNNAGTPFDVSEMGKLTVN
jgi:hypothetical protein